MQYYWNSSLQSSNASLHSIWNAWTSFAIKSFLQISLIVNWKVDKKDSWDVRHVLKCLQSKVIASEKELYNSKIWKGVVIYQYQGQHYVFPQIKIVKPLKLYFFSKTSHKSQFCKTMTDSVTRKEILKKKNVFLA